MPPEEKDAALLWDMIQASRDLDGFIKDRTWEHYHSDKMLRAAVEPMIMIIGEAASKLSKDFRLQNPGVPWAAIIATRHIVVHDYGRVDDEKIWRVATMHVPTLVATIDSLLPPPPPDPAPEPE